MEKFILLIKKLWKLINKDVPFEDEANQFYVMMRIYYIITSLYIIFFDAFAFYTGIWKQFPVLLLWLPLHILSFFSTYRYRRRTVFHLFSVGIIIWIIMTEYFLSWHFGAQYFIYPLLVISFFATSKNYLGKATYVTALCGLHIALYIYDQNHESVVHLSDLTEDVLMQINIITVFLCMFLICLMFSNNNQSALEKLADYNRKLKQEAQTDALTGLFNRHYMYQVLEIAVKQQQNTQFSIAMGDIDFFKKINDTRGHNCGDHVLRSVSAYFKDYMHGKGTVCRWGGEEFLFLFPHINGDDAYVHVQNMRQHIENLATEYEGENVPITMTFGVEEYFSGTSVTELIKRTDDKLYIGKESGRNQVVY